MTTTSSHTPCRRCDRRTIQARRSHIFAVPCEIAGYRVSMAIDTDVPTPEGWTTIGDITPGQRLFDEEGRICTVTDVSGETEELTHRLVFGDGSSIVAGMHHPWMILTPADFSPANLNIYRPGPWNAGCWPMTTLQLAFFHNELTGWQARPHHYIPIAGVLDLPVWEPPVDPWLLGLWLGDGNSTNGYIVCCPDDEPHYRERVRAIGENWRVLNPEGSVLICSLAWGPKPRFLTRLREMNVVNNKHVPSQFLRASHEQRLALLQGLIDSDGHVYASGRAEFTSKSMRLAEGVRELALSLGMKATVREAMASLGGRKNFDYYRVRFTPTMPVATLPRKVDIATAFIERRPREAALRIARRRIDEVQDAGMHTTRCISVDSQWGMMLVGRQMLPALVRRAETP